LCLTSPDLDWHQHQTAGNNAHHYQQFDVGAKLGLVEPLNNFFTQG
jgi:hypothetical protein